MKKLSTFMVATLLVFGSNLMILNTAQAFSFGNFDMDMDDNNWGPNSGNRWGPGGGWGSGPRWGNRSGWGNSPRWRRNDWGPWDRMDDWGPMGSGPRWGNGGPRWGNNFSAPRFNMGDGDGMGWGSKKGPRWGNSGWNRGPGWGNGGNPRWNRGPGPGYRGPGFNAPPPAAGGNVPPAPENN